MIAGGSKKVDEVKYFWEFLKFNLNESDLKNLLLLQQNDLWTALQFSTWNPDFKVFLFIKWIYEKIFTVEKIQKILLMNNYLSLPFIHNTIMEGSFETSNELSLFLEQIFADEKLKLRKILLRHNEIGVSIFNSLSNAYENKVNLFKDLLQKSFNDKDLYEKYLKHYSTLRLPANENFTHENEWFDIDFNLFLNNLHKLSRDEIKILLSSKNNENNGNLLHDLMKNSFNEENLKFLTLLQTKLNWTGISTLLLAKEIKFNTPILFAVQYQTSFVVKHFWNFTKTILHLENQKILLTDLNHENKTVFQISAKYLKDFNVALDIYEKSFSLDELQNILTNFGVEIITIIKDLMLYNSIDSCENFINFLGRIFNGKNETLQNILSLRNEKGETIFNIETSENKIKLFITLYSKTFANQEDFNKTYSQLKVPFMFDEFIMSNRGRSYHSDFDLKFLRSSKWTISEFKYFIENYSQISKNIKNIKSLLFSQGIDGNTLLHEMALNNDEENFESFLLVLEKVLDKKKIFNMLELQNNQDQNSIMIVARFNPIRNVRNLFSFMKKHLTQNETKNLLRATDKNNWTTLQYSSLNRNSECFVVTSEIYKKNFDTQEINKILMRFNSNQFFLFDVVKISSLDMVQKIARFIEKLFGSDKNKLREFLVTKGGSNGSIFVRNSEKICVFEDLLQSTFDNSQDFSFYLSSLRSHNFYSKFFKNGSTLVRKEFTSDMFYDLDINFDKYQDNVKAILLTKNINRETILHELTNYLNKDYMKPFLDNVQRKLVAKINKSELLTLFLTKAGVYKEISLMKAVRLRAYNEWKFLWTFIEKNLSQDDIKSVLLEEQKFYWTSLQYSMFNQDSRSFIEMKNIYEKYFTKEKIQNILIKTSENSTSFLNFLMEDASDATCKEVANYLLNLFKREKRKIVEILSHRDSKGYTVFTKFNTNKNYQKKIKILEKLLRDSIENENDINLLFSLLNKKIKI